MTGNPGPKVRIAGRGLAWHAGGRRVLGPVDLDVLAGEALVVIGPNGAGKTTLLRLLTGLERPSAGALAFDGRPYAEASRRQLARRIAYVPQIRPARLPLTVEEMVLLGRFPYLERLRLAPRRDDFEALGAALAEVGIEHLRRRRVDRLSGGERQAAFIAAALAQEAEVLVLDEPSTHLDPGHQRDIARLLLRLGADERRTVVTATHDLQLAGLLADRVCAVAEGQIKACGTPEELLAPAALGPLFGARFDAVQAGGRALPILSLEA